MQADTRDGVSRAHRANGSRISSSGSVACARQDAESKEQYKPTDPLQLRGDVGASEFSALSRLVQQASERGGALVVYGEQGVGKTSLLTAASQLAHQRGARVLRVAAVPSEADLTFSGLHQLLLPLLASPEQMATTVGTPPPANSDANAPRDDLMDHLPAPQRKALRAVLGLEDAPAPDHFLVGLAALTLLANVAEERALLCVIDDAHMLDRASAQALAFVARRLCTEHAAMLFATREVSDELTGLPVLVVRDLAERDVLKPRASLMPASLDKRVRGPIIAETAGGQLASLESPEGVTTMQMARRIGLNGSPGPSGAPEPRRNATLRNTLAATDVDSRGTRVIVADDDVLMREGLASLLERSGYEVVGQAGDAPALMRLVREHQPDLAVVDVRMPPAHRTEGLDAARTIREEHPNTAILILSAHVEVEHAMTLLASGRRTGYMLKSRVTDLDEFLDAVGRVSRGGSVVDPAVVQELVASRDVDDPLEELTSRERDVLALMAEGRSNAGIGRRLWITDGTVEKHVHSILTKLRLPETNDDHRRVLAVVTFLDVHQTD
jgi:DNA-binding NarL/FixJ family response regulator